MRVLVGIPISPWTEKARWALDHHGIAYKFEAHLPLVNEILLRARQRKLRGRITAPMLFAGDEVARDSYEIARYAERHGRGEPLFFDPAACIRYEAKSQAMFHAGRALLLARLQHDGEARAATLPSFVPAKLKPAMDPVARVALEVLVRKYDTARETSFDHEATLRRHLEEIRKDLGGRAYLLGDRFSFADLATATALQCVAPVADAHVPLPPAVRRAMTYAEIARSFADLVEWREALYARHRGKSTQLAA